MPDRPPPQPAQQRPIGVDDAWSGGSAQPVRAPDAPSRESRLRYQIDFARADLRPTDPFGLRFSRTDGKYLVIGASIVVVMLVLVTLIFVSGVRAGQGSRVTSSPAPSTPAWVEPKVETMQGPGFSFINPAGWARASNWGQGNDARLIDRAGNDLTVYIWPVTPQMTAERYCQTEMDVLKIWVDGTIAKEPAQLIDGIKGPSWSLTGTKHRYHATCVKRGDVVIWAGSQALLGDADRVDADRKAWLTSWRWR